LVANKTSKIPNFSIKFIIHKKIYRNDILFDYQNVRIYAYFGIMCGFIQGGIVANIDFQPLGLKSDHKEGGDFGNQILTFKPFTFSQHQQFYY
jgi:hypothetical protein